MTNNHLVDKFTGHFSQQIAAISSIDCDKLYNKLLYVCVLDTLATCRYPKKDNRTKFIKFTRNYSNWDDGEKVSLVHLYTNLEYVLSDSEKEHSKLYSQVFEQVSVLDKDKIYRSEIDLEFNSAKRIALTNEISYIKYAQHYALLYEYRNSLVHGLKDPGHPIEIDSYGTSPYYDTQESKYWELIYPTSFFHVICEASLEKLKDYLTRNNINPYSIYEKLGVFDEIWASPRKLKPGAGTSLFDKIISLSSGFINYLKSTIHKTV